MVDTLLDSYAEANQNATDTLTAVYNAAYSSRGQIFKTPHDNKIYKIKSAKFYLSKSGSPIATAKAQLWSVSGTPNTAQPSALIAESDAFDVSTLTGALTLTTLSFSGAAQVNLTQNTWYAIQLTITAATTIDASNKVVMGYDSTGEHDGNQNYRYTGFWVADTAYDLIFYVYGEFVADIIPDTWHIYNSGNGTLSLSGTQSIYEDTRLTATADAGYILSFWVLDSWDNSVKDNPYYIRYVSGETHSLKADFAKIPTLIDSYSQTNADLQGLINCVTPTGAATYSMQGQSFTSLSSSKALTKALFYISIFGSPTGSISAKLYAHTGTYGSGGIPTGDALATSINSRDIATLPPTTYPSLVTFNFTPYTLEANTNYVICVEPSSTSSLDDSNYVSVWRDSTSPSHAGNGATKNISGFVASSLDRCFYVYGETPRNMGTLLPDIMSSMQNEADGNIWDTGVWAAGVFDDCTVLNDILNNMEKS